MFWIITFSVISFLILASLLASCIIFFKIFYSFRKPAVEFPTPEGAIYDPYRNQMIQWIKEIREMEHRDVSITSHDGLRLCGKYYEYKKDGCKLSTIYLLIFVIFKIYSFSSIVNSCLK